MADEELAELRLVAAAADEKYQALVTTVRAALSAIDDGHDPRVALAPLSAAVVHFSTRWTREKVLEKAQEWHDRYGEPPSQRDWSPSDALKRTGDTKLDRWADSDWPSKAATVARFGSWSQMLEEAGLPEVERRHGTALRQYEGFPVWSGWRLLRHYRERATLSQQEAGRRAGMSGASVGLIESGKNQNPTVRTLLAIAYAIDVPVAALMEYTTQEDQ